MNINSTPWYTIALRRNDERLQALAQRLRSYETSIAAYRANGEHFGQLAIAEARADAIREAMALLRA